MSNILLLDSLDFTVVNTVGEHAEMPASNLATNQPKDIHQSTNADATLQVDLGSAMAPDMIALLYTNAPADAAWSVRAAATQGALSTGTVVQASTDFRNGTVIRPDGRSHGLLRLVTPPAFQWWQIRVVGGTVPGGLLQMGRLMIGNAFEPTYNMDWKGDYRHIKPGSGTQLNSGSFIPDAGGACRGYQTKLRYLTEDEAWTDYHEFFDQAINRPVLAVPDFDSDYMQRQLIYGALDVGQPTFRSALNEYQTTINMREMV